MLLKGDYMLKTNVTRLLDKLKIDYQAFEYDQSIVNGEMVAKSLNEDVNSVYKTLVTVSNTKEYFVFVIPVCESLDLKKCAKAVGVKSIEMIKQRELLGLTGYIHGGCSPIGMKKFFKTFVQEDAQILDDFYISGGHVGLQINIKPIDLEKVIDFGYADLICDG